MAKNKGARGKKFETEIKRMLEAHPDIAHVHRPVDVPPAGRQRFMTTSPIDLYCFMRGGQGLLVECKSVKGTSLPFKRFSTNQWRTLYRCWRAGVDVRIALNVYGWARRDGQRGHAYLIPFGYFVKERQRLGWFAEKRRKSWPLRDVCFDACRLQLTKVAGSWAGACCG